jgi:uncharacterized membrane protein YhaH (DUF805 family)
MTTVGPITTAFRKYADFGGRATRPQFWWFALFVALVSVAVGALTLTSPTRLIEVSLSADSAAGLVSLSVVWALFILVPSLAVTVRRLHDGGRGEQELLWLLLPIVGWIILTVRLCQPSAPPENHLTSWLGQVSEVVSVLQESLSSDWKDTASLKTSGLSSAALRSDPGPGPPWPPH